MQIERKKEPSLIALRLLLKAVNVGVAMQKNWREKTYRSRSKIWHPPNIGLVRSANPASEKFGFEGKLHGAPTDL
ncbi:hypothetical protein DUT91_17655 [Phyllobacterium salinisoli]|uniref:Uncharacterized protein n=1 Tax=Phyllobacterium salinisoli TaxID=1899321 RepID=A0A368K2J0_9HYPH|nr:hypothetical protein DUT91_17655 [Phyllobacterium salinisoli]